MYKPTSGFLKSISIVETIMGIMACISVIVILAPKDWADTRFSLDLRDYPTFISDDRYSGGNSTSEWINEEERHWRCKLNSEYVNPYCNMTVNTLDENWKGLDLRKYDEITLWGKYQGDGQHVRVYLRNRHPAYFKFGDENSTKYNMVEIPVNELEQGFSFHLKDFGVADWWLASRNIPLEHSSPEFNDIVFIELQTGSLARQGIHDIQIDKIELRGNLISNESLYRIIIIIWSAFIFSVLLFRVIRLKLELRRSKNYQTELVTINNFLNLQNKHFEDLAKTDQLTGLYNRIGIRDILYESLKSWKAERKPFSFVLIDIDHFKQVNDSYGHDVGDEILRATAAFLKANVRSSDYLARWGGEEFILICPNTDIGQAQVLAELLRKRLEGAEINEQVKVTASFGVASMTKPDLDHLFKTADEALYEAKNQGRNCVVCRY